MIWYLPFGEKGSVVCWPFPLAFPVAVAVGVEVCVSSDAEAEALIWGRSKMSRTEKLDVRGILISSNLERMIILKLFMNLCRCELNRFCFSLS